MPNMEFYSPQPEHAQLESVLSKGDQRLLSQLHQQVLRVTNPECQHAGAQRRSDANGVACSSIDTLLSPEEHPIPSPPLSPKLDATKQLQQLPPLAPPENGIRVQLSWQPGLSPKRYRYAHASFLGEYGILAHSTTHQIPRRRRYRPAAAEMDRTYRTRRYVRRGQEPFSPDTQYDDDEEVPERPSTPRRLPRSKTASAPLGSPLASATAIQSIPQYVPNMSWEKLSDYSPNAYDALPVNNNKCLKVEWKGSPMDLSHDPLRSKLHPAEIVLAQILRLPCDLYLDSKRRLFLEKVHRLKQGLPFRRTDAQKACRIDVNKASRLYAAYERVGWLSDSNFEKFL
ncbi:FUN19 (YAL034C) and YOR338W [Zygosaccharomyces parabailii]|nr:FUN19 (YAL034C) and YOR338W [Zygosaccharomyces parabailii]